MARELVDRRDCLFGRQQDLDHLIERSRFKGMTAVVGRPFMGKSWLLTELARRLTAKEEPRPFSGFAESYGEQPDLLLRAVVDLYDRWLSDAGYRQQAKMAWNQQKPYMLPGVASAIGRIFKELGEEAIAPALGPAAKPVLGVVEDAINGLVAANQTLKTAGIALPVLQYDQARDLVRAVSEIGQRPIVLVLDQWEKSPDPTLEAKTLNAFLHRLEDWPDCHIFLALRPDEPAFGTVERLVSSLPGPAEIHRLQPMALDDHEEGERLVSFLRQEVPAAAEASSETLLEMVGGYPGVVYQWRSDYQRARMKSLGDLSKVASDAEAYRFSELEKVLPELANDQLRLAIRLALLPVGGASLWLAVKLDVLDGLDETLVDDLKLCGLLEDVEVPSLGHAKRWEVARIWVVEHRKVAARQEVEGLVKRTASQVRNTGVEVAPHLAVLLHLFPLCRELSVNSVTIALCQAAASLFVEQRESDNALKRGTQEARDLELSPVFALLAMGLVNALNHAKAEEELDKRDQLLQELRALAKAYPEDTAVREQLAKGLFNTLNHAKEEDDLYRRNQLLQELCALAEAHPEDTAVREQLAMGLGNTLIDAKAEGDRDRRDQLLHDLRALAGAPPEDAAVREKLARGLAKTLLDAEEESDPDRRDQLLQELRALAEAHPKDAAVREKLVLSLFNTLSHVKAEDALGKRDQLLQELRALVKTHPEDAIVREGLAGGLLNTLIDAKAEDDLDRRDQLLQELRALVKTHPEDAIVRDMLAKGLLNTLYYAKEEKDLNRRDQLLQELHALAKTHSEDAIVHDMLAKGLFNTLHDAKEEDDLDRRDQLLQELRALVKAYPENATVREELAASLFNTLYDAKAEDALDSRDQLLQELRALARAHPDDAAVRKNLALGLTKALLDAKEESDLDRPYQLLQELRALAAAHPDDSWVDLVRDMLGNCNDQQRTTG